MSVALLYRASNLIAMDYPFEASLASGLAFADEACIVAGRSQDGTDDLLYGLQAQYGASRVKIKHEAIVFDQGWQERWWRSASDMTGADWLMYIDADEVLHENDAGVIAELLKYEQIKAINFPVTHFYGSDNWFVTPSAKWLTRNTRIGRRSSGYEMRNMTNPDGSGCACHMVIRPNGNGSVENAHTYDGPGVYRTSIVLLHYGWVRNAQALAVSQAKHRAWYHNDANLFDGHIPDVSPWDFRMRDMYTAGKIALWNGEHPACMTDWIARHEPAWDALDQEAFGEMAHG